MPITSRTSLQGMHVATIARAGGATIVAALTIACSSPSRERRAADSAVAAKPVAPDTGAVAPEVDSVLALSRFLSDSALARLPKLRCLTDTESTTHDLRRTVRGPLPDGSGFVVYVRAAASDSALHHAEVVRHPKSGQQIGIQWDPLTDSTRIVYFPASTTQPGRTIEEWGGGTLRPMREMARRALAMRCDG